MKQTIAIRRPLPSPTVPYRPIPSVDLKYLFICLFVSLFLFDLIPCHLEIFFSFSSFFINFRSNKQVIARLGSAPYCAVGRELRLKSQTSSVNAFEIQVVRSFSLKIWRLASIIIIMTVRCVESRLQSFFSFQSFSLSLTMFFQLTISTFKLPFIRFELVVPDVEQGTSHSDDDVCFFCFFGILCDFSYSS